jgi:ADP-ribosylglycohydrolase
MLAEAAIGDAYGAGFEFRDMDFIRENNHLQAYFRHGLYESIFKTYTDDTQMALAIAELVLEEKNWTPEKIADKFVAVFHRDKRLGYSGRMYDALDTSKNGRELMTILNADSSGNGSAMRAYPLGYIKDINQLLEYAAMQARISHDTPEGIMAARRIALAAHYFIYNHSSKESLIDFLNNTLQENEKYQIVSPVDMHGYPTTQTVIRLVSEYNRLDLCLKDGIDLGGDTDTVASLCMALLSLKKDSIKTLPDFLWEELENGKFGRDYLKVIDQDLKTHFL